MSPLQVVEAIVDYPVDSPDVYEKLINLFYFGYKDEIDQYLASLPSVNEQAVKSFWRLRRQRG